MSQAYERLECKIVSARAFHILTSSISRPTSARELIQYYPTLRALSSAGGALQTSSETSPKLVHYHPRTPEYIYIGQQVGSPRGKTLEEFSLALILHYHGLFRVGINRAVDLGSKESEVPWGEIVEMVENSWGPGFYSFPSFLSIQQYGPTTRKVSTLGCDSCKLSSLSFTGL
jgi:hypothetical protein